MPCVVLRRELGHEFFSNPLIVHKKLTYTLLQGPDTALT